MPRDRAQDYFGDSYLDDVLENDQRSRYYENHQRKREISSREDNRLNYHHSKHSSNHRSEYHRSEREKSSRKRRKSEENDRYKKLTDNTQRHKRYESSSSLHRRKEDLYLDRRKDDTYLDRRKAPRDDHRRKEDRESKRRSKDRREKERSRKKDKKSPKHKHGRSSSKRSRSPQSSSFTDKVDSQKRKEEKCPIVSEPQPKIEMPQHSFGQSFWREMYRDDLPVELLVKCQPLACDICDLKFDREAITKSHYRGKQHAKKARVFLEKWSQRTHLRIPRRIRFNDDAAKSKEKWSDLSHKNTLSIKEREKIFEREFWPSLYDGDIPQEFLTKCRVHRCMLCQLYFENEAKAKEHYQTRTHDIKAKEFFDNLAKETGKAMPIRSFKNIENDLTYCHLCEIELTSRVVAMAHYEGKSHARQKMKKEMGQAIQEKMPVNLLPSSYMPFPQALPGSFYGMAPYLPFTLHSNQEYTEEMQNKMENLNEENDEEETIDENGEEDEDDDSNEDEAREENSINNFPPHFPPYQMHFPCSPMLMQSFKRFYCVSCQTTCSNEEEYQIHIQSDEHTQKSSETNEENFQCLICNIQLESRKDFDEHLISSDHQIKKIRQEVDTQKDETNNSMVDKLPSGGYICNVCQVECTGIENMNMHLSGKTHRINLNMAIGAPGIPPMMFMKRGGMRGFVPRFPPRFRFNPFQRFPRHGFNPSLGPRFPPPFSSRAFMQNFPQGINYHESPVSSTITQETSPTANDNENENPVNGNDNNVNQMSTKFETSNIINNEGAKNNQLLNDINNDCNNTSKNIHDN